MKAPAAAPILGIDFGTTNTSAAFFDRVGKLRVVPVNERSFVLPSVVWFHAADKALVGHAARTQIVDDPRHTVFGAKRFLGRRYDSRYVSRHRDRFAFELVPGQDGYTAVKMYGHTTPLTDVVYLVLRQIAALARQAAGEPLTECVLTVPAHATIRQREALRFAAQKAGLTVRAVVNEPTAAALYYANLRSPEQTVLVFDLGGGTFDATALRVRNRLVQVLATGGDAFLGGSDFDGTVVEHLVEDFARRHGVDLGTSKVVMQRLVFAAENAKIALSQHEAVALRVPCVAQRAGAFVDFDYRLTRARLEQMVSGLIEGCVEACDDVLARAGLTPQQVDELVLVGGQTRMPALRRRLAHFPRISSDKEVHPELGVAVGAAILGRNLARGGAGLADVVPMPIGVMAPGLGQHEVIPANTPVSAPRTVALEGLPPSGSPVPVALFEALDRTSLERELLGTVQVPPDWRLPGKGTPSLELCMGPDFTLSAALVGPQGRRQVVPIVDPRPQARG